MAQALDVFLPAAVADEDRRRRMFLLVVICIASIPGAVLHIAFYFWPGVEANLYYVCSTLLVVPMLMLVKRDRFELAVHMLLSVCLKSCGRLVAPSTELTANWPMRTVCVRFPHP